MKQHPGRLLLLLCILASLACRALTPGQPPTPTPAMPPATTQAELPTESSAPKPTVTWDIVPDGGSLVSQLAKGAREASDLGLLPVAEFGATWCPACVAIQQALAAGEPLMVDAFRGVYVIRIDVDLWPKSEIAAAGFDVPVIPKFFKLDSEGRPTGDVIDGGAWGENIPENMAPPLKEFFNE